MISCISLYYKIYKPTKLSAQKQPKSVKNQTTKMTFAIQPLFPSSTYPTIFLDKPVAAPAENFMRWLSVHDYSFTDGRRVKVLITWTACPEFPTVYEPLAEIGDDGTPTRFLIGMLQPDMTYRMPTSPEELAEFTQTASVQNPETGALFQLPFSAMCVSATLRNMVDDLGGLDGIPIPIGANIIDGSSLNTLQLLQMLQILGNPTLGSDVVKNWSHTEVPEIDCDLRIPQIDAILKSAPSLDETPRETELASAIEYPQFKFAAGWTDYLALDYWVTAVDFLDIQPLCMYIAHAYACKIANI